jgi:antitoxin (DNA-binding transcriptional repressor) of toxin-antitoxin stability system
MVTKTIDLQTTPTDLETLLAQLTPDTEIILTKDDVPVARLLSTENTATLKPDRVFGQGKGDFIISDDFDAPLPDEFWMGSE